MPPTVGNFPLSGVAKLPNVTVAFPGEHWSRAKAQEPIVPGEAVVEVNQGGVLYVKRAAAADSGSKRVAIALRTVQVPDVNTGPGSLAAAREFLKGRWLLESFEVRLPNEPIVTLKGGGILIYDEMGNLSINIRADEKSADILRAGGVDMRDGAITADGRTAIDIQNHTLTYIIKDQAPLVKGPLGTDRPRYWAVEGDMLILSTKDKGGQTVSVGRWRRSQ